MNIKKIGSDILSNIKTVGLLLWSKGASILALAIALYFYNALPKDSNLPFIELFAVGIFILGISVAFPLLRLLVFNEVSRDAESGEIDKLLAEGQFTPRLAQYWFATGMCILVCLAIFASIL